MGVGSGGADVGFGGGGIVLKPTVVNEVLKGRVDNIGTCAHTLKNSLGNEALGFLEANHVHL